MIDNLDHNEYQFEDPFDHFESAIFTGKYFSSKQFSEDIWKNEDNLLKRNIMKYLHLLVYDRPVIAYFGFKKFKSEHPSYFDFFNPNIDTELIFKASISFIWMYVASFQRNIPTKEVFRMILDIENYYHQEKHSKNGELDRWFLIFLIHKLYLYRHEFISIKSSQVYWNISRSVDSLNIPFLNYLHHLLLAYTYTSTGDMKLGKVELQKLTELGSHANFGWYGIYYFILQSDIAVNDDKYLQALEYIKSGIDLIEEVSCHGYSEEIFLQLAEIVEGGQLRSEVNKYIKQKFDEYTKIQYKTGIISLLKTLLRISKSEHDIERLRTTASDLLLYANLFHQYYEVVMVYRELGDFHFHLEFDFDTAYYYFENARYSSDALSNPLLQSYVQSIIYASLADYYNQTGELTKASELNKFIYNIPEHASNYVTSAVIKKEQALNYSKRGQYQKAIDTFKQVINLLSRENLDKSSIWYRYQTEYGILLNKMEQYKDAEEVLLSTLGFWTNQNDKQSLKFHLRTLYELMKNWNSLKTSSTTDSDPYFLDLQNLALEHSSNELAENYLNLANAFKYKQSGRLEHKVEAMIQYRYLAQADLGIDLKIETLLALIEILAMEFRLTQDEAAFSELLKYLDNFYALGKDEENYLVIINYMIINARIELTRQNFTASMELLENAKSICKDNNLWYLLQLIEDEIDHLSSVINQWSSSLQENERVVEKVQSSILENYIAQANSFVKRKKE